MGDQDAIEFDSPSIVTTDSDSIDSENDAILARRTLRIQISPELEFGGEEAGIKLDSTRTGSSDDRVPSTPNNLLKFIPRGLPRAQ